MKTYFIKTFGCQMNYSDSERIAGFLEKKSPSKSPFYKGRGFRPAKNIDEADLVIFNTCGVRQSAEDRVYGQIHNLKLKAKSQKLKVKIILTGCLANRKDVRRRLKGKVDLFCEIKEFPNSILLFLRKQESSKQFSRFRIKSGMTCLGFFANAQNDNYYFNIKPKYSTPPTAYIPIMTGCNNFCSYCVVPYARGREISRPASEIIREIKSLIKKDYKEIVLLGQNVNSYCSRINTNDERIGANIKRGSASRDRNGPKRPSLYGFVNFSQLLQKINAIPGNFWINFISNHPKDVTDEMIETVAKCKKVCECFHLPIQAGNDEIIKRMNRKYTAKEYLKKVEKIKKAYKKYKPGALYSATSDIIVGFPGETRKQFLDSANIMKRVKYDMVYFGQYSPRPGTAAWKIKDNVSRKEKARREKYLNEVLKKTTSENNKKYVGTVQEILANRCTVNHSRELFTRQRKGIFQCFGRTRTMKNVRFESEKKNLVGKFVKVKITKANVWNLEGMMKK